MIKLPTVGLIAVKDNKMLLAFSKNKKAWYLPGGKIDVNETPVQALQREVKEELNLDIDPDQLKFYCHISVEAYGETQQLMMEQDCFLYEIDQHIVPGNEIEEVAYFNRETYLREPVQVAGVIQVFDLLEKDNFSFKVSS
jgi:8-oxo-dGTP pyrophosphatase MutT (NUDIX family)